MENSLSIGKHFDTINIQLESHRVTLNTLARAEKSIPTGGFHDLITFISAKLEALVSLSQISSIDFMEHHNPFSGKFISYCYANHFQFDFVYSFPPSLPSFHSSFSLYFIFPSLLPFFPPFFLNFFFLLLSTNCLLITY